MIYEFARFSDIRGYPRFDSDSAVRRFMEQRGDDFDAVVEHCRQPGAAAPFENLVDNAVWTVRATGGASVAVVDSATGEQLAALDEDGVLVGSVYQHQFLTANAALNRAVENASLADLESAIVHGIASLEAYLNYRASRWNKTHAGEPLLDSKPSKVRFEDKVRKWVPTMASGRKLDLSDRRWADFLQLQALRDSWTIHPKHAERAMSYGQIADYINMFRTGIAGLLVAVHMIFRERIPGHIIRAQYAAEVEAIDE